VTAPRRGYIRNRAFRSPLRDRWESFTSLFRLFYVDFAVNPISAAWDALVLENAAETIARDYRAEDAAEEAAITLVEPLS
jgi:hypothetical protein